MRTDPPPPQPQEEPRTWCWQMPVGPAGLDCVCCCTKRGQATVRPQPACSRKIDLSKGLAHSIRSPPGWAGRDPNGGTGRQLGLWSHLGGNKGRLPPRCSSLLLATTRPAPGRYRVRPEGDVQHRGPPHSQPVPRSHCWLSGMSQILRSILYLLGEEFPCIFVCSKHSFVQCEL